MLTSAYYGAIPRSLREELMGQLARKAETAEGAERADYLVSLMTAKLLQNNITREEFTITLTQAARLGSIHAKWALNAWIFALPAEEQSSEACERNKWILELVIGEQAGTLRLIGKIQQAIPDLLSRTPLFEDLRAELRAGSYVVQLAPDLGISPFALAMQAIADGNTRRLRRVVESHMDTVLSERWEGHTLLHVAARFDQPESALSLVREYNANIDLLTDDGLTALALATIYGNSDTMYALVNAGANIQYVLTPRILRLVANDGLRSTLRELEDMFRAQTDLRGIERYRRQNAGEAELISIHDFLNCDVPAELDDQPPLEPKFSPLCAAIVGDNTACLQTLLEMGCSTTIYAPFTSRSTIASQSVVFRLAPIHLAASQLRPWHLAILIHHGKDPELRTDDEHRQVPLHLACTAYQKVVYKYPNFASADRQLPSPDEIDPAYMISTRLFMIRILVEAYGADVDAQDAKGRTALFFCMAMPHCLPIMQYLVHELKADVRVKDYIGQTCLHHAAALCPEPEYLEFCIAVGCEISERDHDGATPLVYAERRDNNCFAQVLREHGAVI
jgi:ankyrin repeat protein